MRMARKVVVGISGGVDSAVTALLLKNKGYDVHGVFMQNWDIVDETGVCSASEDYKYAAEACDTLQIPLKHVNFVKEYWNEVFLNLTHEYNLGCTPNPDILCNRHIKFNYFYKYARKVLGADAIATGHYARTSFGDYLEHFNPNTNVRLLRAKYILKDQTFFLCQIHQEALRRTMFPLGNVTKPEVKRIALDNKLEKFAKKKESMGICFIGSRSFKDFLSEYIEDRPGDFIDIDTGKIVGQHNGIHLWTIGQRARIGGSIDAYYIAKRLKNSNEIYVARGSKHPSLYSSLFFTTHPHWIADKPKELSNGVFECEFKFQHVHDLAKCRIFETDGGVVVLLFRAIRALTEGQYAVFYKNHECLGSARIIHPGTTNFSLYWAQTNKIHEVDKWITRNYQRKL